ncbi:MAG TPA: cytochrome c oxidase assembly protein [Steroidobacteraceae bacterium]|nr:cytochrome c oxidase assembly protein [Steroidobacteraceae bacterium]
MPRSALAMLLPWDFSPTVLVTIALALTLYLAGVKRAEPPAPVSRHFAFYFGLFLLYCALQTSWDYYASHMFFVHRLQHFILHDVGPALLAASAPAAALASGLPRWLGERVARAKARLHPLGRVIFDPWTATALYIASLVIWIWPSLHFDVMLSNSLYRLMNWSVVLGDLPFWWLVLDPRPYPLARVKGGYRLLMLFIVMLPMMLAGAILALARHDLYPVYGICGRFAPISPLTDQHLGGLIIWIPSSIFLAIIAMVVLRRTLHHEHAARTARAPRVVQTESAGI